VSDINWNDIESNITPNFTVHEATYLPSWKEYHLPTEQEKENLLAMCRLLEKVRLLYGPVIVHCMIRPADYNTEIGGAPNSPHIQGLAADFHIPTINCNELRARLLPKLEKWGCRMECNPGSDWVHLDLFPVQHSRYFNP